MTRIVVLGLLGALMAATPHIMPYLKSDEVGISEGTAALMVTVMTIASIAGRLGFGWMWERSSDWHRLRTFWLSKNPGNNPWSDYMDQADKEKCLLLVVFFLQYCRNLVADQKGVLSLCKKSGNAHDQGDGCRRP